jgi:hypothetical protein
MQGKEEERKEGKRAAAEAEKEAKAPGAAAAFEQVSAEAAHAGIHR